MGIKEDIRHAGANIVNTGSEIATPIAAGITGFAAAKGDLLSTTLAAGITGALFLRDRRIARRDRINAYYMGIEASQVDQTARFLRQIIETDDVTLYTSLDGQKEIINPNDFIETLGNDTEEIMAKTEAIVRKAQREVLPIQDTEYLRMLFAAIPLFPPLVMNLKRRNDDLIAGIISTIEKYEKKYIDEHPNAHSKEEKEPTHIPFPETHIIQ